MNDATTTPVGYWYRFNPERRVLHVCQWATTDRGTLIIRAACGGQVIDPTAEAVPIGLAIPKTQAEAMATIQPEQRRVLCRACAATMARAA